MAGSAKGTVRASSCPDGPAVTLYGTCFEEDKIYAKACASCKLFSQMGLSFMENWCLNTSTKNCNNMLPTMTEQDAADEFCQKFILL
mmetsp:Transcript_62794/g.101586  ORF Transcript_62794/g.101586 Transcript_62794/m.101586 type:complete len:87 (-) Transcript_62794:265-525(-)